MQEKHLERISQLEAENMQLRGENRKLLRVIEDNTFQDTIREALRYFDTASAVAAVEQDNEVFRLLLLMVKRVMQSEAASILLYDDKTDELYFKEAVGEKSEEVKKFRLRSNEGIAGFSFTTGQILAVSDVNKDARFKREIAESIQMHQEALIAAPLIYHEEIIGVMEAVNKIGGGTFSEEDIELLSFISGFAAILIQKANIRQDLSVLFLILLKNALEGQPVLKFTPRDVVTLARRIQDDMLPAKDFENTLELAALVEDIGKLGPEEYDFIKTLLANFREYLRDRGLYETG